MKTVRLFMVAILVSFSATVLAADPIKIRDIRLTGPEAVSVATAIKQYLIEQKVARVSDVGMVLTGDVRVTDEEVYNVQFHLYYVNLQGRTSSGQAVSIHLRGRIFEVLGRDVAESLQKQLQ